MSVAQGADLPNADLGTLEFWGQPAEQRDRYFEQLRRDAPISRHEPPEDILGLPDQGRMEYWAIVLLEDLDARLPDAVEEFVRWASPVMTFRRTTTCEVKLYDETLPPGEKVVLFYHSGNRDERVFDRPWEFDVARSPNRHLGFGGGGPHYCMGASLARTQLDAIFAEMLRVMPDTEAGEPELLRSAFIHGIKRMPCTFTPR